MRRSIKLLEDRVARAAQRLGQLSGERARLEEELAGLRGKLEDVERQLPGPAEQAALAARDELLSELRGVLADLRGS
jgi:hypothetical protein